jgi:hypothetical protein
MIRASIGDSLGSLDQPLGRQRLAQLRPRVGEIAALFGGIDQQLGRKLPERLHLLALRKLKHEPARLGQSLDRASFLEADRDVELARPSLS